MIMAVPQAPYRLIERDGSFEIRQYDALVLAVSPEADLSGSTSFGRLFSFISGNNQAKRKISMTAPVLNSLDQPQQTMAFVMPSEFNAETTPQPLDASVQIREIPARRVAAITFGGSVNQRLLARKRQELLFWLEKRQLATRGPMELARYNPPFLPGFLKRNELLIDLKEG
jgi:hypothetical protein